MVPTLLTPSDCQKGTDLIIPSVEHSMSNLGPFNRRAGLLVVLNPAMLFEPKFDKDGPRNGAFLETVPLHALSFGNVWDEELWQYPFAHIAVAKAWATFKYRQPSDLLVHRVPYILTEHMTKYGGSTIDPFGGLIASFSGVQAHFDLAIAEWEASALRAISRDNMEQVVDSENSFIDSTAVELDAWPTIAGLLEAEKERRLLVAGS